MQQGDISHLQASRLFPRHIFADLGLKNLATGDDELGVDEDKLA